VPATAVPPGDPACPRRAAWKRPFLGLGTAEPESSSLAADLGMNGWDRNRPPERITSAVT